jgi:two-component system sensor kinase FixL
MKASQITITRWLTARYLFALGLIAGLAATNYWLLHVEMRLNETSVELLTVSGRQRTLLQSTALLSQAIVNARNSEEREPLLASLHRSTDALERAHHRLVDFAPIRDGGPPREIRRIYESSPWLLDTEIRNYLTQLREFAKSNEDDFNLFNPHYWYIRDVALKGDVMQGLEEVVKVYQSFNQSRAEQLRRLAMFSILSTIGVLILTGFFVFRPMIRRVRSDMRALNRLNETLEVRVAERTAEAEQRANDLLASEALYHSLVESLPLGVVRENLDGRLTFANIPFLQMTGLASEDIVGTSAQALFERIFKEGKEQKEQQIRLGGNLFSRLRHVKSSSGDGRIFEMVESPVLNASMQAIGSQTLIWDITDRRAAEERMLRAERLAAIGEMTAGVAHESRNALQQINACAKMLEWETDPDSERSGLIADIQKAHDRLHRLFEDLRGYVSPIRPEHRLVTLGQILLEAWNSIITIHDYRVCHFYCDDDPNQTECWADPFQFEQVFRNIFENAVLVSSDPLKITVKWTKESLAGKPALGVTIIDNGPGLTPEVQKKIFDPFFTTRTEGTGLGMAIVRRIVDAHKGQIFAEPATKPNGTKIRIIIPKGDTCNDRWLSLSQMTNRE